MGKVPVTGTVHTLPFDKLSGKDFERLVYAYVSQIKNWDTAEWTGETGSDGGRDIWCTLNEETYCYQCANYHPELTLAKVQNDINRLIEENYVPQHVITICGGRISNGLRDKIKAFAMQAGVQDSAVWSGAELEEKIRIESPHILLRFFGNEPFPGFDVSSLSDLEQFELYKELCCSLYSIPTDGFVHFSCVSNGNVLQTDAITFGDFGNNVAIVGESGCGKSMLARKMLLQVFENEYIPLILDAKYYDNALIASLNTQANQFGFTNADSFFACCKRLGKQALILIDGLNECRRDLRTKLMTELGQLTKLHSLYWLVTTQEQAQEFGKLSHIAIHVSKPDISVKIAIASKYCDQQTLKKLEPILQGIGTCLEAKVIGELGADGLENTGRFALLELFVRQKLDVEQTKGMKLLSVIGRVLSERITFSISLTDADSILEQYDIEKSTFDYCVDRRLLNQTSIRVSFAHEIFMNFFVADSIVRFSNGPQEILSALRAPKNYDKLILIIGGITDLQHCSEVLAEIKDSNLLSALSNGDAGKFSASWLDKRVQSILPLVLSEVKQLRFEVTEDEYFSIDACEDSLYPWSDHQWALIHILTLQLLKGKYLKEIFETVFAMDEVIKSQREVINSKLIGRKSSPGLFNTVYGRHINNRFALNSIFDILSSGLATFDNKNEIPETAFRELTGKGTLKMGQFYLLLLLCKASDHRKVLYSYTVNCLKEKWSGVPFVVQNEILDKVGTIYETEEERLELIKAIQILHENTSNPWESTNFFDALSSLGALDDDATAYEEVVAKQIQDILSDPENEDSWRDASFLYNAQFDHPYEYAFSKAIAELGPDDKKVFLLSALKGQNSALFSLSLIKQSAEVAGVECCPYYSKWMQDPLHEKSMVQEGISSFMWCHIFSGKMNYPLTFAESTDELRKGFFACAEAYYWLNRTDMDMAQKKLKCARSLGFLCAKDTLVAVQCVMETERSLAQFFYNPMFLDSPIVHMADMFKEQMAIIARNAVENPDNQKSLFPFSRPGELINYAISTLGKYGDLSDVILLRRLCTSAKFGKSAVSAIKSLEL